VGCFILFDEVVILFEVLGMLDGVVSVVISHQPLTSLPPMDGRLVYELVFDALFVFVKPIALA
jgi:hypothetical protein